MTIDKQSTATEKDSALPALMGTRAVVADDDRFIRTLLDNRLEAMGCETFVATNGADAWSLIIETNPNIAFVDLEMPGIDGYELMERIRAHPRTRHLPVVVVTSSSHKAAIDRAFSAGATSFLLKPIRWSTFSSHVHYLLRLTRSANEAVETSRQADAALKVAGAIYRKAFTSSTAYLADIQKMLGDLGAGLVHSGTEGMTPQLAEISELASQIDCVLRSADRANQNVCASDTGGNHRVALNTLLASAIEGCQTETLEAPIALEIEEALFNIEILCKPEALALALSNLLDDAVAHAIEPVRVILRAELHEDFMLAVSVLDDGPGMSPEYAFACLEPLTGAPEVATGTVGLPLVRALIEAHGGRLELRTSPGRGTAATLTIPPDRIWADAIKTA